MPTSSSSNFAIYLIGFLILIGGLAWGAWMLGVPPTWIGVGVVCLLGIAVLSAVKKTQVPPSTTTTTTVAQPDDDRRR